MAEPNPIHVFCVVFLFMLVLLEARGLSELHLEITSDDENPIPTDLTAESDPCTNFECSSCPEDSMKMTISVIDIPYTFDSQTLNVVKRSAELQKLCCPDSYCSCKDCPGKPQCPGQVIIEVSQGNDQPGTCCFQYKCGPKPAACDPSQAVVFWTDNCTKCNSCKDQCESFCDPAEKPLNCMRNNVYKMAGETWLEDNGCSNCTCVDGDPRCVNFFCDVPECVHPKVLKRLPDVCCPVCEESELVTTEFVNMDNSSTSPISAEISTESTGNDIPTDMDHIYIYRTSTGRDEGNDIESSTEQTEDDEDNTESTTPYGLNYTEENGNSDEVPPSSTENTPFSSSIGLPSSSEQPASSSTSSPPSSSSEAPLMSSSDAPPMSSSEAPLRSFSDALLGSFSDAPLGSFSDAPPSKTTSSPPSSTNPTPTNTAPCTSTPAPPTPTNYRTTERPEHPGSFPTSSPAAQTPMSTSWQHDKDVLDSDYRMAGNHKDAMGPVSSTIKINYLIIFICSGVVVIVVVFLSIRFFYSRRSKPKKSPDSSYSSVPCSMDASSENTIL